MILAFFFRAKLCQNQPRYSVSNVITYSTLYSTASLYLNQVE